eukprot:TRINITY_DN3676_c0_g3_i1.p1 TRINITY_DN3676_c0_g3~~TRINITY_DN3676_c0_g3_i1.p1  ORF type:complete len:870 (-),score=179.42 TRINITY_DN3676_c0_g3_i1:541-3150(-)
MSTVRLVVLASLCVWLVAGAGIADFGRESANDDVSVSRRQPQRQRQPEPQPQLGVRGEAILVPQHDTQPLLRHQERAAPHGLSAALSQPSPSSSSYPSSSGTSSSDSSSPTSAAHSHSEYDYDIIPLELTPDFNYYTFSLFVGVLPAEGEVDVRDAYSILIDLQGQMLQMFYDKFACDDPGNKVTIFGDAPTRCLNATSTTDICPIIPGYFDDLPSSTKPTEFCNVSNLPNYQPQANMCIAIVSDFLSIGRVNTSETAVPRSERSLSSSSANSSSISTFPRFYKFCVTKYSSMIKSGSEGVDGMMGFGYFADDDDVISSPRSLLPPARGLYAFDFNSEEGTSFMHAGGYSNATIAPIHWGEAIRDSSHPNQILTLFDMGMCGTPMLADSSWWTAVLSSSPCLGLPSSILNMLINYVGISCTTRPMSQANQLVCHAEELTSLKASLPLISFSLAQDGPPLYISLDDLVKHNHTVGSWTELCVYNSDVANFPDSGNVVLGTHVLRQFYTVLDLDARRVGLSAKKLYSFFESSFSSNTSSPSFSYATSPTNVLVDKEACALRVKCRGAETFLAQANECEKPLCEEYYYQEIDTDTMECRVKLSTKIGAVMLFVLLAMMEVVILEQSRKIQQFLNNEEVKQRAEREMVDVGAGDGEVESNRGASEESDCADVGVGDWGGDLGDDDSDDSDDDDDDNDDDDDDDDDDNDTDENEDEEEEEEEDGDAADDGVAVTVAAVAGGGDAGDSEEEEDEGEDDDVSRERCCCCRCARNRSYSTSSVGNSVRQTGQEFLDSNHGMMQSVWYRCSHGNRFASSPTSKSAIHTEHSFDFSSAMIPSVTVMVDKPSLNSFEDGGGPRFPPSVNVLFSRDWRFPK